MFAGISRVLHSLVGLTLGIIFLPIAYIHVFPPLGFALAVTVWPLACSVFCIAVLTSFIWIPALIVSLISLSVIGFCLDVLASLVGTVRDAFCQPPQHPQPYREVPALSSGIPASRSDSVVAGHGVPSTPGTPGIEGATDMSKWLEQRFAELVERDALDSTDEFGMVTPASRGLRSHPTRRPSSVAGASSSSVNIASTFGASSSSINTAPTLGASTTSVNGMSASAANNSSTIVIGPVSPIIPTRRRSRTKSMSLEDGFRPGLSTSHSTTSMVTGSPRVCSQHEVNSSTTSLASAAGSTEGVAEPMRAGQTVAETSDHTVTKH